MPQDAYTLRRVALELDAALAGGRVNRIAQPSKDEVTLLLYTGRRTVKLVLNTNASDCGAYFSERDDENPLVAPNFCMLLRKHLHGAELLSVSLVGFERICRFRFRAETDFTVAERELLLEVMGKYSNLILTENGVILGALKTNSLDTGAKRLIFAGVPYALPAAQDKANPSDEAALRIALAGAEGDLGNLLFTRVAGLAPCTAESIAASYHGGDLISHVRTFLFDSPTFPCVLETEHGVKDFYATKVAGATPFPSLLEAESYFYEKKRGAKTFEADKRRLSGAVSNAVKKAEKRLALILDKKLSCADAEKNRKKGELLTANIWQLARGMRSCELPDYSDPAGGKVKISLDERLGPAENAQSYFKRYRKQKRTLEALAPQERETGAELDYLRSLLAAVSSVRETDDLRSAEEEISAAGLLPAPKEKRKVRAEIPFRRYEMDGFVILAGRNNLQNDRLLRSCSPNDTWLHAQRYHSCHVVIRSGGREVPEGVLRLAANVCARHSDGGGDRIPVDYCPLSHVKKPPKSKAGFVIYSDFKTTSGDPNGA